MTFQIKPKISVPARRARDAGAVMTRGEMLALSRFAGQYVGGRTDRNALKNWNPLVGSADGDTVGDLPTLRARSRDLVRNAPIATGAVGTVTTNVVGTGLRLRAQINHEFLELTEEQGDAWERKAEQIWRTWSESTFCDLTRTQDFAGLEGLALRGTLESGDMVVIRRHVERPGAPLSLALQLIEGDRLSTPDGQIEGPQFIDGVEKDEHGSPTRYHIRSRFPETGGAFRTGPDTWDAVPVFGPSGARIALHLFERLRPDQTRGVPLLAPVMEPLKQLDRYTEAEIMAAVVSAFFTVFVRSPTGQGLGDLEAPGFAGAPAPRGDYRLGAGAILDLGPGEEVTIANPGRPNTAFDPFVQAVLRQIGVALGLPFEVLIMHFTASYSASRAALETAAQFFRARRSWLVRTFCAPVYEWVVTEAVLRGMLVAPGFMDNPFIRAAYLGAEWIGPSRISLDPLKEARADAALVDLKVKTRAEVCVATTGVDLETKIPQIRKEERLFPSATAGIGHNGGPSLDGEDGDDGEGRGNRPGRTTEDSDDREEE